MRTGLRSIRSKLLAVFLLATFVPLSTGLVVAALQDLSRFRQDLVDRVSMVAYIVEEYSAADLAFQDPSSAQQTLSKLVRLKDVRVAALYSNRGAPFAEYSEQGVTGLQQPAAVSPDTERAVEIRNDIVFVLEPVVYRGQ